MTANRVRFRIHLCRRFRLSSTAKNAMGLKSFIKVQNIILCPGYIRPNQTCLYSNHEQEKQFKREYDIITEKILFNLSTYHNTGRSLSICKQLSGNVKACLTRRYMAQLFFKNRLHARKDLKLVKSIRRKLKKANHILRVTDKSNVFCIGRAIDFEQKAQAYRTKTSAYIELPSNPLREIFLKVIYELNDFHSKNLIRALQHKKMLPDRRKTKLANMYILPKAHKNYYEEDLLQTSTLFCTFDITDLYTMLPREESLNILEKFLRPYDYEQVHGIPIDVIRKLAHVLLTENVINGSVMKFNEELDKLNQSHPNIKLVRQIGKVSFLDVLIHNDNDILSTSVYHKEVTEPYIVPFVPDHPRIIFSNTIDGALIRPVRYSSTLMNFNDERHTVATTVPATRK
ncbi:unnamed protein product [Rotaria sp. Silwood1]|nr:unnamed protein product [Rotaria sp. Silwood1]